MPLFLYPPLSGRVRTSERRKGRGRKSLMHSNDRRIDTETRSTQRSKEVDDIECVEKELLAITTHPPLEPAVDAVGDLSSDRVKVLLRQNCVFLAVIAHDENRWEGVAELQNACSADEGCQVGDLRNGAGDNQGQTPVDWYECYPGPLSHAIVQRWEAEDVAED